jgi:polyhydroxybutyrate depolymerase
VEGPATQELVHLGGIQNPTRATRMLYGSVPGAAQVELVRIDGGGHIEPSLTQRYRPIYERLVGHQNHDFESAEEAWRFFSDKHAAR